MYVSLQHPLLGWWPFYYSARERILRCQTIRRTSWESSLPIFKWVGYGGSSMPFSCFRPGKWCISLVIAVVVVNSLSISFFLFFLPLVNAPVEKLIFYSFIIAFNLYNVYSWRGRGYIVFGGVHFLWGWFCFLPLGRHFFIGSLGDCCSLVAEI